MKGLQLLAIRPLKGTNDKFKKKSSKSGNL